MEKAIRAFVSHIRAYSKHECTLLLRVQDLPLGSVATSYGLLQLPKMPELKNKMIEDFQIADVDINNIPYKDKQKEAARLIKFEQYKKTGLWPGLKNKKPIKCKPTEPWSRTKEKKEEKKAKKLQRKAKKELNAANNVPTKKRKRKGEEIIKFNTLLVMSYFIGISEDDMAELLKDVALLKKLKKKKISDEEYAKEIGLE